MFSSEQASLMFSSEQASLSFSCEQASHMFSSDQLVLVLALTKLARNIYHTDLLINLLGFSPEQVMFMYLRFNPPPHLQKTFTPSIE